MNIETFRAFAISLPHVTEDVKWGKDLCFCISEKMFCVTGLEQKVFKVSLKVRPEEFDSLIEKKGIVPAPYLARHKWILIEDSTIFSREEWQYYVSQSYELVKSKLPKKLLKELNRISFKSK